MVGIFEFVQANGVFISLPLLLYCAWRLRSIESKTEAIRYMLFRDYEEDLSNRGMYPISKSGS